LKKIGDRRKEPGKKGTGDGKLDFTPLCLSVSPLKRESVVWKRI
jgi:hypothetical protein